VLVDFWFNHFNVYAGKGRTAEYLAEYEREAIRRTCSTLPRPPRSRREESGMLFYLDNWLSADRIADPSDPRRDPGSRFGVRSRPFRRFASGSRCPDPGSRRSAQRSASAA
jgi:hypothetical protein